MTGRDVNAIWQELLPLQGLGIILILAFSAYLGMLEKARGAGINPTAKRLNLQKILIPMMAATERRTA